MLFDILIVTDKVLLTLVPRTPNSFRPSAQKRVAKWYNGSD